MIASDPDLLRGRPVNVKTFWDDLKKALDANPAVGPDDAPMADQARMLLALRETGDWKGLLDRVALEADAELHASAKYHQVGVDAGGNQAPRPSAARSSAARRRSPARFACIPGRTSRSDPFGRC
jgi:hypothetical protein